MRGHCLCGQVEFEISGSGFKLYQCHCSLCRKQSGSASNAATIVPAGRFRWLRGKEQIASWVKDSGFRSDFCKICGSPIPNPLKNKPYYWIPVGLLEDNGNLEVVAHLYTNSKAPWDTSVTHGVFYEELPPDLLEFIDYLQLTDN